MQGEKSLFELFKVHLLAIYKEQYTDEITTRLVEQVMIHRKVEQQKIEKWDQTDAILITYGGSIRKHGEQPLHTLRNFLKEHLPNLIRCVHILPFFPYSSDDGFSVIDYNQVDPELGDWSDVEKLGKDFELMFDLVINHISQKSTWFQNYLKGISPGNDYFIEQDPDTDLSKVVRPRSLPLLSPFETKNGLKYLWTTFSNDQIDLNFSNPEVLLEMMKVLIYYVNQGARIIRLDAIAFLWKEIGTSCLHLTETHQVVKLIRNVVESVDLQCIVLTETNVPNKENLSYFGDNDEAHMVYQFSLPPLLLHALHTGNSKYISDWAGTLPDLESDQTFFNFTASHDGIGVRPLEGLLPEDEFKRLTDNMKTFGGEISTKANSDGSESPYEINITYFDALKGTQAGVDEFQVERFLCSQTIMMSLKGIPAFYIHSLTATPNYYEGVKQTGRARSINRKNWELGELQDLLSSSTPTSRVFDELRRRMAIRRQQMAFHPNASQEVKKVSDNLFSFIRKRDKQQELYVVANISNQSQEIILKNLVDEGDEFFDLLEDKAYLKGDRYIKLKPYQVLWLQNLSD